MGELSFTAQPQAGFGYAVEDLNTLSWAGADVRVTPAHRIAAADGWVRAGDLGRGDLLLCLDGDSVAPIALDEIRPAAPDGPVYDLEVDVTRTYFTEGLLAHNKMF